MLLCLSCLLLDHEGDLSILVIQGYLLRSNWGVVGDMGTFSVEVQQDV